MNFNYTFSYNIPETYTDGPWTLWCRGNNRRLCGISGAGNSTRPRARKKQYTFPIDYYRVRSTLPRADVLTSAGACAYNFFRVTNALLLRKKKRAINYVIPTRILGGRNVEFDFIQYTKVEYGYFFFYCYLKQKKKNKVGFNF